jgi:peptide-methionine (R)-S-oxide reductase
MRFPRLLNSLLYTVSSFARRPSTAHASRLAGPALPTRTLPLRAGMPIPFISSLFGTSSSASDKMSYPDKRSDDEWRAVLNKGVWSLGCWLPPMACKPPQAQDT